jgi:hypothetical protein
MQKNVCCKPPFKSHYHPENHFSNPDLSNHRHKMSRYCKVFIAFFRNSEGEIMVSSLNVR